MTPRTICSRSGPSRRLVGFKIWSNNPIERRGKEIKRRADVVEIFPNTAAFLRLATVVVIETHDDCQATRGARNVRTTPTISLSVELAKILVSSRDRG